MIKITPIFAILAVIMLSACEPDYVINETYEMPNDQWVYEDSVRFDFTIEDTLKLYDLTLDVKYTTNYRFQNLYTKIHTHFPDGQRLSKPVSLELANAAGEWRGNCNAETCTTPIPIQTGAYFNQSGDYTIVVEQFMRESPVNGVQSLTLKVRDTGKQR